MKKHKPIPEALVFPSPFSMHNIYINISQNQSFMRLYKDKYDFRENGFFLGFRLWWRELRGQEKGVDRGYKNLSCVEKAKSRADTNLNYVNGMRRILAWQLLDYKSYEEA